MKVGMSGREVDNGVDGLAPRGPVRVRVCVRAAPATQPIQACKLEPPRSNFAAVVVIAVMARPAQVVPDEGRGSFQRFAALSAKL